MKPRKGELMKLEAFYKEIIKIGIENDPRGKTKIKEILKERKKNFEALTSEKKEFFDQESLFNPYTDSRIIAGDPQTDVRKILAGIDIDTSELLLAYTLNKNGEGIDLVLSHHPAGKALVTFYEVMDLQVDIFYAQGISLSTAENLLFQRKSEVERRISASNFARTEDSARLLGLNLISAHTPADNLAYKFVEEKFSREKPKNLDQIIDMLLEIEEYKEAAKKGNPPRIINGRPTSSVKKIHVEFTGGTEGPKEIYEKLANSGVDTIVSMHLSEEHYQSAKKANLNIVLAGHISSDSLGLNLLLDKLQEKFQFKVLTCSGFKRFSHPSKQRKKRK